MAFKRSGVQLPSRPSTKPRGLFGLAAFSVLLLLPGFLGSRVAARAAGASPAPAPSASPRSKPPSTPDELAHRELLARVSFQIGLGRAPSERDLSAWRSASASDPELALSVTISIEAQHKLAAAWIPRMVGGPAPRLEAQFKAAASSRSQARRVLRIQVLESPEFWKHCGETRAGFIEGAHQLVLGRKPRPAEREGWKLALERGLRLRRLIDHLLVSEEGCRAASRSLFREVFGREIDPDIEAAMVNAMAGGFSEEALLANLYATPESLERGPRAPVLPPPVDAPSAPR